MKKFKPIRIYVQKGVKVGLITVVINSIVGFLRLVKADDKIRVESGEVRNLSNLKTGVVGSLRTRMLNIDEMSLVLSKDLKRNNYNFYSLLLVKDGLCGKRNGKRIVVRGATALQEFAIISVRDNLSIKNQLCVSKVVYHELCHLFGLVRPERSSEGPSRLDIIGHCKNNCIMHKFGAEVRDCDDNTISFCMQCLGELWDFFKE
jgi:hypothetical protein